MQRVQGPWSTTDCRRAPCARRRVASSALIAARFLSDRGKDWWVNGVFSPRDARDRAPAVDDPNPEVLLK
jgi:hypothetical protein